VLVKFPKNNIWLSESGKNEKLEILTLQLEWVEIVIWFVLALDVELRLNLF
jgi:hypothetical protein